MILFCNAGITMPKLLTDTSATTRSSALAVNLLAPHARGATRDSYGCLRRRKGAHPSSIAKARPGPSRNGSARVIARVEMS
jgi:hypothetical protein